MSKAKIGVIGAGWWATEYHIPDLKKRDDVELIIINPNAFEWEVGMEN